MRISVFFLFLCFVINLNLYAHNSETENGNRNSFFPFLLLDDTCSVTANAGSNQSICNGQSATIGLVADSGIVYNWSSTPSGFFSSVANPSVSPTITTTYYLITSNSCATANDSVIITVTKKQSVNVGIPRTIFCGQSTRVGALAVSNNFYNWSSNPSGFISTDANPLVNPSITTTYYLTQISPCDTGSARVIITVINNPSSNSGVSQTISCGLSAKIGATAVVNNNYSWISIPADFISKLANPTITPTITTTYILTQSNVCGITTGSIVITVSKKQFANTGNSQTICSGQSATIGEAAVLNNNYSWSSNPKGFISTIANPSVTPTITTTYSLTQISFCDTATTNVVITVSEKQSVNAGNSQTICIGLSAMLGTIAVSNNNYSWSSNPKGFNSTNANASVTPTVTTTYSLTSKSSCGTATANIVINVLNNLIPDVGIPQTICSGSSLTIGVAAISDNSYSWSSDPKGFLSTVSNPLVSPTITTTYILTSTSSCGIITKNLVINVSKNQIANVGNPQTISCGESVTIGAGAVYGNTYSWTSNPAGFFSTEANPSVSPAKSTIYYLISTSSCGSATERSVKITVKNSQFTDMSKPKTINCGSSTTIGTAPVFGNTYSWASEPPEFILPMSNPKVTPTVTTTYTLTQTNVCGTLSASVVITVTNVPIAKPGPPQTICLGQVATVGLPEVPGDKYSWTSEPSGFFSTYSDSLVYPIVTTTYTLIHTMKCGIDTGKIIITIGINDTYAGDSKKISCGQSVTLGKAPIAENLYSWTSEPPGFFWNGSKIIISPTTTTTYYLTRISPCDTGYANAVITVTSNLTANAGSPQTLSCGETVNIGAPTNSGMMYSWTSDPLGFISDKASPSVNPTITTTYYLTKISPCDSAKASVVITVRENPTIANAGADQTICETTLYLDGNTPTLGTGYWKIINNDAGIVSDINSDSSLFTGITGVTYSLRWTISNNVCGNSMDDVLIAMSPFSEMLSDVWIPKADFGGAVRQEAVGFSIGTKGYIGTGLSGVAVQDFWEWDQAANVWTQKADFAGKNRYGAVGFSIGTKGYIATGDDGFKNYRDFWEWDQATNVWKQKIIFGGSSRMWAVGFSIGNKGYIGTGADSKGNGIKDFWEWDESTNSWTQKADFAGTARHSATGFSIGTKGYIGTGYDGKLLNDFWEWDQATNVWTQKNDFGGKGRFGAVSFSIGTRGFIGTGRDVTLTDTQDFWEWEQASDSWTQRATFIGAVRETAVGFSIGTKGYIGTGSVDSNFVTTRDFFEYTPILLFDIGAGPNQTICSGQAVTIGSTVVSSENYSWTSEPLGFNSTISNPAINPTTTTTYSLIVSNFCRADSTDVIIFVNNLPEVNTGLDQTICLGDSTVIGNTAISGNKYKWSSNPSEFNSSLANPSINPTVSTTYNLIVTSEFCGSDSGSVMITVNENNQIANAGNPQTLCAGQSVTIGETAIFDNSYSWTSTPINFISTLANPPASPTVTTTYHLTLTSLCGISADSVVITTKGFVPIITSNAKSFCEKDTINLMSSEANNYLWSNGKTSQSIVVIDTGKYFVTITDSFGCTINSKAIIVFPKTKFTINLSSPTYTYSSGTYQISTPKGNDGLIELTVNGNNSYKYFWSNKATTEDISNLKAGFYKVIVTDTNGCSVSDSIVLKHPKDLEMPNGYSPNNDGENDFFVIHGLEFYPENQLRIYNRWGNIVYFKKNYANEWNGANTKGEELPDATYFVILEATDEDGTRALKGFVDMRRQ